MADPIATYSIVACDLDGERWGVATQAKFLAVGSIGPWAEPHVGAIATQSYSNPRYGPEGLALLRAGRSADHERPLEELRRLYGIHHAFFGKTPRDEWVDLDAALAAELQQRLAGFGYDGALADALPRWAANENLEERVDGVEQLDPVVLEKLRAR